jgi:hypothetical protein
MTHPQPTDKSTENVSGAGYRYDNPDFILIRQQVSPGLLLEQVLTQREQSDAAAGAVDCV